MMGCKRNRINRSCLTCTLQQNVTYVYETFLIDKTLSSESMWGPDAQRAGFFMIAASQQKQGPFVAVPRLHPRLRPRGG